MKIKNFIIGGSLVVCVIFFALAGYIVGVEILDYMKQSGALLLATDILGCVIGGPIIGAVFGFFVFGLISDYFKWG